MSAAMHRGRRGLTLIELTIALAIVVVLGGLALPSFRTMLEHKRLAAAAHALAADLGEARQEAQRTGRPVQIVFGRRDAAWCWLLVAGSVDPAEVDCATRDGGTGARVLKRVDAVDHPGVALLEHQPMRLEPGGATPLRDAPSALLADARGETLQVRLSRLGRASVCAPGAPVGGMRRC